MGFSCLVKTWWRDAENVAFAMARKEVGALRCDSVYYYKSFSGQNPDFMEAGRTPHCYVINAVAWRKV